MEPGEAIAVAAKRELQEEAGLAVDGIELLTSFRNDSKPDERYCVQYVPRKGTMGTASIRPGQAPYFPRHSNDVHLLPLHDEP